MSVKFDVKCPGCGSVGVASEENIVAGLDCPQCHHRFMPPVPTWWEKQTNTAFVKYFWIFALLIVLGIIFGRMSDTALFGFIVICILGFIAVQVYKIANKERE